MGKTQTGAVPAAQRQRLRALVDELGEGRAAAELEVPRTTLVRVLADLPVRRGTSLLLQQQLAARDGGDRQDDHV